MSPIAPSVIATFLAAFARAAGLFTIAPLLGNHFVPPRFRIALAAALALLMVPVLPRVAPEDLLLVIPAEALLGLSIGFVGRVVLAGAEAGGQLIGLNLQLGFAGHYDPIAAEEALPTRRIVYVLAAFAFLGAGGLEACIRAVSVARIDGHGTHALFENVVRHSGSLLTTALRFAAPSMIAALIANIAAALASRAAPALNVFSVAFALVLVAGAAALVTTAPALVREVVGVGRGTADVIGGYR